MATVEVNALCQVGQVLYVYFFWGGRRAFGDVGSSNLSILEISTNRYLWAHSPYPRKNRM